SARLQVEYCTIRSPMAGRTGTLVVHEGNVVKANENPALVVINQLAPIYVNFAVPEHYLSEVKRLAASKLAVEAAIPQDQAAAQSGALKGVLTFVDNTVDNTTGTIRLKA